MILNPNKCHYMCIGKNTESDIFRFENICLENSKEEIILGITNDNKLTFASHIKSICREASQKLHTLSKISQFSYFLLVWMFCSRNAKNLIKKFKESL